MKKIIGFLLAWIVLVTGLLLLSLNRRLEGADGLEYNNYMGPVMPLMVMGSSDGMTATRDVTYDFASYGELKSAIPRIHTDVTDSYTLCNSTDADMTVELVYPFQAKLQDWDVLIPDITVDGASVESELIVGGDLSNGGRMNSGEKLIAALEDGSYFAEAFEEAPALDLPCIVYRIDDFQYDGQVGGEITLEFGFHLNNEKQDVMMYNVMAVRHESKRSWVSLRMDKMHELYEGASYLILLGEDIADYTLQAYSTPQCEEGSEVDGFSAEVTRTETTLGEWMAAEIDWSNLKTVHNDGLKRCIADGITDEQLLHYAAEQVEEGILPAMSEATFANLDGCVSAALYVERMLYLTFPVTIPAGETVTVVAQSVKYSSPCYGKRGDDVHGYELMTSLGSVLNITEQTVRTVNTDGAELVDNNFGFDWEKGITEVILDPNVQHYWMQIRKQ